MLNTLQAVLTAQNKFTAVPLGNGQFKFTLTSAANTSAGVYNSSDQLIRTLWSGKKYDAGTHIEQWDGLLDNFITNADPDIYTVKLLTNNVQYTWEGVIGNTSKTLPSYTREDLDNRYGGFGVGFSTLTFSNTRGYAGDGFAEGQPTLKYFDLSDLTSSHIINIGISAIMRDNVYDSDTDTVYWACYDDYTHASYIFATKASDNTPVSFQNEQSFTSGRARTPYSHFIGLVDTTIANSRIYNSLATQIGGNYLYVGAETNELLTFNKHTGALLNAQSIPKIYKLYCSTDSLWLIRANPNYAVSPSLVAANRLTGTIFSSTPYGPGQVATNSQDGDLTTAFSSFASSTKNDYVGLDLGIAKTVTQIAVVPETNHNSIQGMIIQGSNTSTTDGFINLYTIPDTPPEGQYTGYIFPNSVAYRYIRIYKPNDFCNLTEFAVFEGTKLPPAKVVEKYTINPADGTVTYANITLSSQNPDSLGISSDGNNIAVGDTVTSQVVVYSTHDGTIQWTKGLYGGFNLNGPEITPDKFDFVIDSNTANIVRFLPNGGFVIQCVGTGRLLFYDSNKNYVNMIASRPASRSSQVDPNNPSSIFSDQIEYYRDYTKSLKDDNSGSNGSWRFAYYWKFGTDINIYNKFETVVTLSERAYGFGNQNMYLLDKSYGARYLGRYFGRVEADGSLWIRDYPSDSNGKNYVVMYRRPLTGFDSNFTPQWGPAVEYVRTPSDVLNGNKSPIDYFDSTIGMSTNPRKFIFYNPRTSLGYHLGSVKAGGSTYEWLTCNSTRNNGGIDLYISQYHGNYPKDGWYDIGNNDYAPQHNENAKALIYNSDIFQSVYGEFWKTNSGQAEINIHNHFHECGLFLGQFGTTGLDAFLKNDFSGMAGNNYGTAICKVNNDYYFYHCDENTFHGVYSWHISGLDTINLQNIPLNITAPVVVPDDPTDLMRGLPWRADGIYTNIAPGWNVFPTTGSTLETDFVAWYVGTSVYAYAQNDIDLYVYCNAGGNPYDHYVTRDFPVTNSNNWKYKTSLMFYLCKGCDLFEILDINGKILVQVNFDYFLVTANKIKVLDSNLSPIGSLWPTWGDWNDLTIESIDGVINITYAYSPSLKLTKPFEAGGDLTKPAEFRLTTWGNGDSYRTPTGVKQMRFIPKPNNPSAPVIDPTLYFTNILDHTFTSKDSLVAGGGIKISGLELYGNNNKNPTFSLSDAGLHLTVGDLVCYTINLNPLNHYKMIFDGIFDGNTGTPYYPSGTIVQTVNTTSQLVADITNSNSAFFYWNAPAAGFTISRIRIVQFI